MNEPSQASRWAAVGAIAATYVYFLIFAEFALLRLAEDWAAAWPLRGVMAVLGGAGVAGSGLAAWRFRPERLRSALAGGFAAAAAGAGGVLAAGSMGSFVAAVAVVGLALGWLTVTLAAGLRAVAGRAWLGRICGLGTGLAYAVCNLPVVFQASARAQTWLALIVAAAGVVAVRGLAGTPAPVGNQADRRGGVVGWLGLLLILVWMDSAAFFVIQHTAELKAATWSGAWTLGGNASVHLGAALLAGWALDRGAEAGVAGAAAVCLLAACAGLSVGWRGAEAAVLYTAGVSLYSTVLVWWPARRGQPGVAALVYAVAGWGGSAMGIGMAQDQAGIPVAFVVVATAACVAALLGRRLGAALVMVGVAGFGVTQARAGDPLIERGREVYVAEGCIHCHSQYVRPGVAAEVERWGPARSVAAVHAETPPLLGNRRQGPDLSAVGARRSPEWQRLHLQAPRALVPGSRMPGYTHLFAGEGTDGEALVAYLCSLGAEARAARQTEAAAWRPSPAALAASRDEGRGAVLFAQWCAACHGPTGRGDGALAGRLSVRPPDWSRGEWRWAKAEDPEAELAVARIIKFGLPGSPMAGHEYFSDTETVALARAVRALHNSSSRTP